MEVDLYLSLMVDILLIILFCRASFLTFYLISRKEGILLVYSYLFSSFWLGLFRSK